MVVMSSQSVIKKLFCWHCSLYKCSFEKQQAITNMKSSSRQSKRRDLHPSDYIVRQTIIYFTIMSKYVDLRVFSFYSLQNNRKSKFHFSLKPITARPIEPAIVLFVFFLFTLKYFCLISFSCCSSRSASTNANCEH